MANQAPLRALTNVVELTECGVPGVREARVLRPDTSAVEWDRWMRLSATAAQVLKLGLPPQALVLDVGGFDGSFALFVPQLRVWVVDPCTTGSNGLQIPLSDKSIDTVVSIDALEHVERKDREVFLRELVRVCKTTLLINFPEARSMPAQELVLSLTGNQFIQEHVEYVLPSCAETVRVINSLDPFQSRRRATPLLASGCLGIRPFSEIKRPVLSSLW